MSYFMVQVAKELNFVPLSMHADMHVLHACVLGAYEAS